MPSTTARGPCTLSRTSSSPSWHEGRCGAHGPQPTCAPRYSRTSTAGSPADLRFNHTRRSQRNADQDRLVDQTHPERMMHALTDLTRQRHDVGCARRAPVGHREGVLGGQRRGPWHAVAPAEAGLVDEPGRAGLDLTIWPVEPGQPVTIP